MKQQRPVFSEVRVNTGEEVECAPKRRRASASRIFGAAMHNTAFGSRLQAGPNVLKDVAIWELQFNRFACASRGYKVVRRSSSSLTSTINSLACSYLVADQELVKDVQRIEIKTLSTTELS